MVDVRVMSYIINLFNHYGYLVLLVSLTLELIAFPLPGEALMLYCGYVVYTNKMNWMASILLASTGTIAGITISYFIGNMLGLEFFERYGHYVHLDKKRIDKVSIWFQNYGSKLLIMAYFIPGVRHVTGYFSGITKVSYKKFAVSAYSGAILWTFTFITLGKVLGPNWDKYHSLITRYFVIAGLIIGTVVLIIYAYKNHKQDIQVWIITNFRSGIKEFNSLGKVKIFLTAMAAVFLFFSVLIIGIIQDYRAKEFGVFDEIVKYLTTRIFDEDWTVFMQTVNSMSNNYVLLIVTILTVILIVIKGKNKLQEIRVLSLSFLGAEGLVIALKGIFHRLGPSGMLYTFPSGEVLLSVVVYGFLSYIIVRYFKITWFSPVLIGAYLILCIFIGLSYIYFNMQYPSDIAAGFEFGFEWLSLSIILLETFSILPNIGGKNTAT
jgi:membrane protein DedA with SNARE-associated domain/membrane-associated phospholipid phosphatase